MNNFSLRSVKSHLRFSGLLEGISFLLLLFVAMPLKYWADLPLFVKYLGWAHGLLFIWYIGSVFVAREEYRMNTGQTALALVASLLPFGTFYADRKIFQRL